MNAQTTELIRAELRLLDGQLAAQRRNVRTLTEQLQEAQTQLDERQQYRDALAADLRAADLAAVR